MREPDGRRSRIIRKYERLHVETACYISSNVRPAVLWSTRSRAVKRGNQYCYRKLYGGLKEEGENRRLVRGTGTGGETLLNLIDGVFKCGFGIERLTDVCRGEAVKWPFGSWLFKMDEASERLKWTLDPLVTNPLEIWQYIFPSSGVYKTNAWRTVSVSDKVVMELTPKGPQDREGVSSYDEGKMGMLLGTLGKTIRESSLTEYDGGGRNIQPFN